MKVLNILLIIALILFVNSKIKTRKTFLTEESAKTEERLSEAAETTNSNQRNKLCYRPPCPPQ